MHVCTSLQTDNHASTPPLCFLQAGCPSCRPTNSVKALKAQQNNLQLWFKMSSIERVMSAQKANSHFFVYMNLYEPLLKTYF